MRNTKLFAVIARALWLLRYPFVDVAITKTDLGRWLFVRVALFVWSMIWVTTMWTTPWSSWRSWKSI